MRNHHAYHLADHKSDNDAHINTDDIPSNDATLYTNIDRISRLLAVRHWV